MEAGSPFQLSHIPVKANDHVYKDNLVLSNKSSAEKDWCMTVVKCRRGWKRTS